MRIRVLDVLAGALLTVSVSAAAIAANDPPKIGVVVKIGGIPWFNAMEQGIVQRAEELGVDAWMVGPTSADPALQVRAIEDLIAQGVDVIGVVPNDAEVLEPVLARAREQGIKVITHESPEQKNADWNFELASSEGFGEAHAKLLAEKMGGQGKYAVFVGSLSVPLHNAWADAAVAYLKENHPEMELVADRFGVAESVDDSRRTALDLMRAHPDLGGILAFGSQGPIGAGRAVDERRKAGEIFVLGPFSPGQGRRLVHDGVLTGGFMWNPMEAGRVFVTPRHARQRRGEEITDGMEIPGLGVVHPDPETGNYHTVHEFERLLTIGGLSVAAVDVCNVGGVTPFLKVAALAAAHHVPVTVHGIEEPHLHLLAAIRNRSLLMTGMLNGALEPFRRRRLEICDGYVIAPETPGHGLELDWDRLAPYSAEGGIA